MGNVQDTQNNADGRSLPPERPPRSGPPMSPLYPNISPDGGDHDYEILKPPGYPTGPSRPAPKPPAPSPPSNTSTLSTNGVNYLDGVPFIVNPKFVNSTTADRVSLDF